MTPELWQRAQALFHDALEIPEAQRPLWLEGACAGETELLALVQSMLATDAKVNEYSVVPANSILQLPEQPELNIGEELGPYRIVGFLGAGGMGQVFRAERFDGVVKQAVAIKLLRHSASAAELRRRFAIERRILARLNHPGIARFIDAGADNAGRPYVVMELIEGSAITTYAQTHKLSLRARLQLFLRVLEAVSYAHAQLIVHRDIKPGNVMVDETGAPRLLDFGIAKPLTDIDEALRAEGATQTTMRAFSLRYAAPEQLKGEGIGLGCDVYSLGGLLYELLTGFPALELNDLSMLKAQERIFLQMPALPSAREFSSSSIPYAAKALKGDLDRIILHALKKEPNERFASIDAFAQDIRRYLNQEPISLRSSVRGYRLLKFIQRHKLPVALAAALVGALFIGSGAMFMQQQRLQIERDNALSQQSRAEQITQLLTDAFEAADPSKNRGNDVKAREVLDQAARRLNDAQLDPDAFVKISVTLANVYRSLGLIKEAEGLAETAKLQLPKLLSVDVKVQLLHLLARNYEDSGALLSRKAAITDAGKLINKVSVPELEIDQRMLEITLLELDRPFSENIEQARLLDEQTAARFGQTSKLAIKTGIYYINQLSRVDRDKNAIDLINERLGGVSIGLMSPQHLELLRERIKVHMDASREAEALRDIADLKRATVRLFGKHSMPYVSALSAEANLHTNYDRPEMAKPIMIAYMKILKELYPEHYPIHAISLYNFASVQRRLSDFENSRKTLLKAISIGEKAWGPEGHNVFVFKSSLALTLIREEKFYEAERILRQALEAAEKKQQGIMNNAMANNYSNLAEILFKTGRQTESIELIKTILVRMSSMDQEFYTKKQESEIRAQLSTYINSNDQMDKPGHAVRQAKLAHYGR